MLKGTSFQVLRAEYENPFFAFSRLPICTYGEAYPYLRGTVPYRAVTKSRVNAAFGEVRHTPSFEYNALIFIQIYTFAISEL